MTVCLYAVQYRCRAGPGAITALIHSLHFRALYDLVDCSCI